jgi:hypothetical protein
MRQAPPTVNEAMIDIDKLRPQVVDGVSIFRVPVRRFDPSLGDVVCVVPYACHFIAGLCGCECTTVRRTRLDVAV